MFPGGIRPVLPTAPPTGPPIRPSAGGLTAPALGVTSTATEAMRTVGTTLNAYGGMYIIYALFLGILITVILLVTDAFYPFLPMNPIMGPSAFARSGQTFWTSTSPDAENLMVPVKLSPTTAAASYSMSIQMILSDSRGPNMGKFRHVLHRGANPVLLSTNTAGSTGHSGIQPGDVSPSEGDYVSTGLPSLMNPGLMLDTFKNDLQVMIHTKGVQTTDASKNNVLLLESSTIENLPLNTPLTIGIICTGKTVEIYVNCKLYTTMILNGTPYLPAQSNQWFGRYGAYPFIGLVKNMQLWSGPLPSGDYTKVCSTGTFNSLDLPSTSCAVPPIKANTS